MKKEFPPFFWKNSFVLVLVTILFLTFTGHSQTCATPGKEDPTSISGVVNTYFPAPASATASNKNIPVGAVVNSESSLTPIVAGDLLLIIQMQDATINASNTSSYGAGTGTGNGFTGGNAGYYEYTVATNSVSTGGGTIITVDNLSRSYYSDSSMTTTRGKQTYQVVRIPQYSTVSVTGTLQAAKWDGTAGGIIAIDVAGNLNLTGTITAAGKGFRGGQGRSSTSGSGSNTDYVVSSSNLSGASKGEGIVGTPRYVFDGLSATDTLVEGYPSGSYDRGAPGNAGGGGTDGNPGSNDQNSGGGGGGNGGAGGLGGNSWSSNLTVGGVGGAAFPTASNRLVMGGGGGAGTTNNGSETTSSGGNGGGMIFVRTNSLSGGGTINADGANAQDSNPNCCGDGAGGGGAGGSIVVLSSNTSGMSGITASAKGGKGGSTLVATANHGPGGGGGGGVILSNASLSSPSVAFGVNGTTTSSNVAYGAQTGVIGTINSSIAMTSAPGTPSGAQCVPSLTVTKSTTTPTLVNSSTVTAIYKITVANAANRASATSVNISDTLPQPVANGFTYSATSLVTLNGSATRPTTTDPTAGSTVPNWSSFIIPGGGSVEITFNVNVAVTVSAGTYQNPALATYFDPARTIINGTTSAAYNSASSTNEDVKITTRPNVTLAKSCISPANCVTNPQATGTDLNYQIAFTNVGSMSATSVIVVDPTPNNTDFKIGSAALDAGTTGLTIVIEYSNDYTAASPGTATWTYTPVSAAAAQ